MERQENHENLTLKMQATLYPTTSHSITTQNLQIQNESANHSVALYNVTKPATVPWKLQSRKADIAYA
jgi:hypothetical protein